MDLNNILYDVSDRVATITLNRPDALNATTDDLYREFQWLLGEVRHEPGTGIPEYFPVTAALITCRADGNGKHQPRDEPRNTHIILPDISMPHGREIT